MHDVHRRWPLSTIMTNYDPPTISKPGLSVRDMLEERKICEHDFAKKMRMSEEHFQQWLEHDIAWSHKDIQRLSTETDTSYQFWKKRYKHYVQSTLQKTANEFHTLMDP